MNKIYIIYDVGPRKRLEWLSTSFKNSETHWIKMRYNEKNRIYRWRKPLHILCYIEIALKAIFKSQKNDYIISWNFIIGAFIGFICRLLHIKRRIISINMISHKKGSLISFFRKHIYNYTLGYNSFYFTVNSNETITFYKSIYKIRNNQYLVLPDCWLPEYQFYKQVDHDYSIFCGGEAQRDWNLFLAIAENLPQYSFIGVARKKYIKNNIILPDNVTMYYDIDETLFNEYMNNSSIVILPLKSCMPSGLIVMFKAIFMHKPLIISRTPSVLNYIEDGYNGLLVDIGDLSAFIGAIKLLSDNPSYRKEIIDNSDKLIDKYSPYSYSEKLYNLISNI